MKRSGGVTAAAVVALLGSACQALLAVVGLLGMLFASRSASLPAPPPQAAMLMRVAAVIGSVVNFGFAAWGIATAIGLFRLKPWSRISILVFSGLLVAFAAFGSLIFLVMPLPQMPEQSPDFDSFLRAMMLFVFAVPFSVGIWWLVLFTRKSVAAQFSGTAISTGVSDSPATIEHSSFIQAPKTPQRPILISILAWFYIATAIASTPWYFVGQFRNMPMPFFGTLLEGKVVAVYYVVSLSLLLTSGFALLKNKIWGFWLAFAIQLFGLLNVGANFLIPGSAGRFEKFATAINANFPSGMPLEPSNYARVFMPVGFAAGAIFSVAVLWLLWTSRTGFFEVATAATSAPTP